MRKTMQVLSCLFVLGFSPTALSASESSDGQKNTGSKGITVDDLGRGLKSAVQNVEKEIPKIGSAIGEAFKKLTDKGSETKSSQDSTKEKK